MMLIQGPSRVLTLEVASLLSLWPRTAWRSRRNICESLEPGISGFKIWLDPLTAVWPEGRYLAMLSLSRLVYIYICDWVSVQMGGHIDNSIAWDTWKGLNKSHNDTTTIIISTTLMGMTKVSQLLVAGLHLLCPGKHIEHWVALPWGLYWLSIETGTI
jgi:hypothetical protein